MRAFLSTLFFTALIGCTQFPDLDNIVDPTVADAPYPELVPIETLLAGSETHAITPEIQTGLASRIARLKSRAASLRRTVIDAPTRERMKNGVSL